MLTVICGEDSSRSRNYFSELKKNAKDNDFEVFDIDAKNIGDILNWINDSVSLFATKRVFFTQGLNKTISKKTNPEHILLIDKLIESKDTQLYAWEDGIPGRFLKLKGKVTVKEFKPDNSIFKLQDSCYPGNIKTFTDNLHSLTGNTEDIFVFIMLSRHIRNLLFVKLGMAIPGMLSWQTGKLNIQASHWKTERLMAFYDNLHRIDVSLKTGGLPFSLTAALDMMASYYL